MATLEFYKGNAATGTPSKTFKVSEATAYEHLGALKATGEVGGDSGLTWTDGGRERHAAFAAGGTTTPMVTIAADSYVDDSVTPRMTRWTPASR